MYGNNKFNKLKEKVRAAVEMCTRNKHVPEIEQEVRVVKARQRYYWDNLPYKQAPRLMVDEKLFEIIR